MITILWIVIIVTLVLYLRSGKKDYNLSELEKTIQTS